MSKWAIYRVLYVELSTRHVHALHPLIPYTLLLHSSCGQSAAFVVLHRPCPVIATSICTCHMVCVLHEKYFDVKPAKVCSGVCVCVYESHCCWCRCLTKPWLEVVPRISTSSTPVILIIILKVVLHMSLCSMSALVMTLLHTCSSCQS